MLSREFPAAVDFSRDILRAVIGERSIVAYPHTSYWEDVGEWTHTIGYVWCVCVFVCAAKGALDCGLPTSYWEERSIVGECVHTHCVMRVYCVCAV